ncbi:MAG: vanadium-dependent haloperoxidase, partial [Actinomycetota bacterium]|nr:vanadium-dependent haloperoxidase [Actinomycetota bacterium]
GCSSGSSATKAAATIPAEPTAGTWKTWVLASADQIKVPPPPAAGSPQATAELAEVKDLAARRTGDQIDAAHKWGDYPATEPWTLADMRLVSEKSKNPPLASRGYALVSVAMADAMTAAWHWKEIYNRAPPKGVATVLPATADPSYPSEHAALAGAASRVLGYLFPEASQATYDEMAAQAGDSRVEAGTNFRSDVTAGLELGREVADAVIAYARTDGASDSGNVNRPLGTGFWEAPPDNPGNTQAVEPQAGTWKTWSAAVKTMVPGPPPAYGSDEHLTQARQVYDVSQHLTDDQKRIAEYWAGGSGTPLPPGIWNQITLDKVRQSAPMSTPQLARTFAVLNTALNDAGIAAWATKYTYWSARPVNAIRDLGIDPAWKPLLPTPVFPSYVSAHSTYSAAAAEVLAHLFPTDAAKWRQMADEAGVSRIYGGIHYPVDNTEGLKLGKAVGASSVRRARHDGADATATH